MGQGSRGYDGPALGPRNGNGPQRWRAAGRGSNAVGFVYTHIIPGDPWGVKPFNPPVPLEIVPEEGLPRGATERVGTEDFNGAGGALQDS